MLCSTGDETLDSLLGGGIPAERPTLVLGGPGTGARRLASGLLTEDSLALTTEPALDTPPGVDAARVVETDDGVATRGVEAVAPNLASLPEALPSYDRILVDAADWFAALAGGTGADWHEVATLVAAIRSAGATPVVTAAESTPLLARSAAVVLECWRDSVDDDYQPFVRVKTAAVDDCDTRRYRLSLSKRDATVVSRETRTNRPMLTTGLPGFDDLAGGFARGGTTVFEHDGESEHWPVTSSLCANVLDSGAAVVCITSPGVLTGQVNDLLEPRIGSVQELMADDSLYLVDPVSSSYDPTTAAGLPRDNVVLQAEEGSLQESIRSLVTELAGRPVLAVLELTPVLHLVDPDQARQLFYWANANVLALDGLSLVIPVDRAVGGKNLAAFLASSAEQVVKTWRGTEGLQYLSIRKSPSGSPARSRVVEPLDESPFVRLR